MAYQLRPQPPIEATTPPAAAIENTAAPEPPPPPAVSLERKNTTPRRVPQSSVPLGSSTSQTQNLNRLVTMLGGLCCFLGIGAVFLFILRWMFKRGGTSRSSSPIIPPTIPGANAPAPRRPGTFRTRMGDDGFWIDAEGVAPGTPLTCRYTAAGESQQVEVRYQPQPGGQFVYTGARPTSVSVIMAGAAAAASQYFDSGPTIDLGDERRREEERRRREEEEERQRRRRFDPPAY